MAFSEQPYPSNFASAPYKHKANSVVLLKLICGIEQCVERVAGTVVACVHHHELVGEPMHHPEVLSRIRIKRDFVVMGPGRYREDLQRIYSSRQDTFLHETVKDHYGCRTSQAESERCFQEPLGAPTGPEPTCSDCLIGVQVHHPENKAATFEPDE